MKSTFLEGAFILLISLQGCSSISPKDNAIFVTKTSIGIDVDSTPPDTSIAYNRIEGYLGPHYKNGAVPPVASSLATDGGIFSRGIHQEYATGRAAMLITGKKDNNNAPSLSGKRDVMFFGTSTTTGVRIGFTAGGIDSFVLGFRRKEISFIPIGSNNGIDQYSSVIGTFSSNVAATDPSSSKFGVSQYFATGTPAESIAAWPEVRSQFRRLGTDAFDKYHNSTNQQNSEAINIYRCFIRLDNSELDNVLDNANQLDLFQDKDTYQKIKEIEKTDVSRARSIYVDNIGIAIGNDVNRASLMKGHEAYVCGLIKHKAAKAKL